MVNIINKAIHVLSGILSFINVLIKQIFSISEIDGHRVIYVLGFHIRSKIKKGAIQNNITEYGLNSNRRKIPIIASLTTFPDRINTVKETIKTLLKQTCKPDELILWLAKEQFPQGEESLPQDLLALKEYGLSIKWCKDYKSYKKLIPALKEYPNDIIITFDDDIYYGNNVVELLYNSYLENPNCISTNRSSRLHFIFNKIWILKTAFSYWTKYKDATYKNSIIGCGGVLYPPHSLHNEVLNDENFMNIIPTQDDVWFWTMAIMNNTPIKVVAGYDIELLTVENTQQYGLCKINRKGSKGMGAKDGFNKIVCFYPEIVSHIKKFRRNNV